jgi:inosose dehydratase
MNHTISRRRFLSLSAIVGAGAPFVSAGDLFAAPRFKSSITFGYSAITWGGKDDVAIREISQLGFKGIQLRANAYQTYGTTVDELKKLLKDAKLELAMFSSGNANPSATGDDEKTISEHLTHARFVKELGGKFLQITNSARPKSGAPTEEELKRYGQLLTTIGKRTKEIGVTVAYHNHMSQLGETPEEVDIILANADPAYVSLLLDVAHYKQGGGDPAAAVRKYANRIKALHIKDVRDVADSPGKYLFVELGQGRVDFPALFKALDDINFKGYAVVELDGVPDKAKTPLECATISKNYLQSLKFKV